MKIIFTGGGTGGHFYPIISVVQAINKLTKEKKLIKPNMYFFSPTPYNPGLLYDNDIEYKKTAAGKVRRYFSLLNFLDFFKNIWGVINALIDVFDVYPDVVFAKGGFGSFPTLFAARMFRIPVVIHESDSAPGKVNKWASKFAYKIAVSYPEAVEAFGKKAESKVAWTGQPIQRELLLPIENDPNRFFEFNSTIPTLLILGGSQGAENINNAVLDALPELVKEYQIIHQAGPKNLKVVKETAQAILLNNSLKERYKVYGYLSLLEERMAAGAASLIISRAGSTIFEIASWGKASIIIPIDETISHDQTKNALAYARSGSCIFIKDANLTQNVLMSEINRILKTPEVKQKMEESAKAFFKPDADLTIAYELLQIGLSHEELG